MAYSKHTWLARIGENLNRFLNTTTGQYGIYQSAPTSISQEGTPFNVTWMNEMEDGIAQGADRISPNLLINTNFLSPINQRGMTSYNTVNKYGIDRWRLYGGSPSLSVSASGVTVSGGSILQPIENINSLAGTTFTLSAKKSGAPSESITGVLSTNTVASSTTYDMEFYISGNYVNVRLGIGTWEWVKLEVGEYASAYSPRPYADELVMCQRYYESIPETTVGVCGGSQSYGSAAANASFIMIPFKTTKRTVPTITVGGRFGGYSTKSTDETTADMFIGYWGAASSTPGHTTLSFTADAEIY